MFGHAANAPAPNTVTDGGIATAVSLSSPANARVPMFVRHDGKTSSERPEQPLNALSPTD